MFPLADSFSHIVDSISAASKVGEFLLVGNVSRPLMVETTLNEFASLISMGMAIEVFHVILAMSQSQNQSKKECPNRRSHGEFLMFFVLLAFIELSFFSLLLGSGCDGFNHTNLLGIANFLIVSKSRGKEILFDVKSYPDCSS